MLKKNLLSSRSGRGLLLGSATFIIAFFLCKDNFINCQFSIVNSTNYLALAGGLYLPFVADAVIKFLGKKRKASGAGLIEFAGAIATLLGWFFNYIGNSSSQFLICLIILLFLAAAFLQKTVEKKVITRNY